MRRWDDEIPRSDEQPAPAIRVGLITRWRWWREARRINRETS